MSEIECEIDQKTHRKQARIGAFKGLLSSIPFVGSPIVGAWDSYWNSRFQETVEQLSVAVEKMGEEKIDKPYVVELTIPHFPKRPLTVLCSHQRLAAKMLLRQILLRLHGNPNFVHMRA